MNAHWYVARVYIPHSSDKTEVVEQIILEIEEFTSLIVQIKPLRAAVQCNAAGGVYIPHSSDKTEKSQFWSRRQRLFTSLIVQIKLVIVCNAVYLACVYIPHSSDKTFTDTAWISHEWYVYIPHSSDKTFCDKAVNKPDNVFTSLIVQIKQLVFHAAIAPAISLHPS